MVIDVTTMTMPFSTFHSFLSPVSWGQDYFASPYSGVKTTPQRELPLCREW